MIRQLLVVVALIVAACTPQRKREVPAPPTDPTRLDHAQHAHVACGNCHRDKRPGLDDHKPCDDAVCHKREFGQAPRFVKL